MRHGRSVIAGVGLVVFLASWAAGEEIVARLPAKAVDIPGLADPDPATRRAALAGLLQKKSPAQQELLPALVKALDDPDEQVRRSAAKVIGRFGPQAAGAVPALADWTRFAGGEERSLARRSRHSSLAILLPGEGPDPGVLQRPPPSDGGPAGERQADDDAEQAVGGKRPFPGFAPDEFIDALVEIGAPAAGTLVKDFRSDHRVGLDAAHRVIERIHAEALVGSLPDLIKLATDPEYGPIIADAVAQAGHKAVEPIRKALSSADAVEREGALAALRSNQGWHFNNAAIKSGLAPLVLSAVLRVPADSWLSASAEMEPARFGYGALTLQTLGGRDLLLPRLNDPDPIARANAAAAVGLLLSRGSPNNQNAAARTNAPASGGTFSRRSPEDGVQVLVPMLKDADPLVRLAVIKVLRRRDRDAVRCANEVIKACNDPDPTVRAAAVEALGRLGDHAGVKLVAPIILAATKDKDIGVGLTAAEALFFGNPSRLYGPDVPSPMEGYANVLATHTDSASRVRILEAMARELRDLTPARGATLECVKDPDPRVRVAAVVAIGRNISGNQECLPALRVARNDADPRVRMYSLSCLTRAAGADIKSLTEAAAKDPDLRVRTAGSFIAITRGEYKKLAVMEEALARSPDAEVRLHLCEWVVRCIPIWGAGDTFRYIRLALNDKDLAVKSAGARFLAMYPQETGGEEGTAIAVSALAEMLAGDPKVQLLAARTLIKLKHEGVAARPALRTARLKATDPELKRAIDEALLQVNL